MLLFQNIYAKLVYPVRWERKSAPYITGHSFMWVKLQSLNNNITLYTMLYLMSDNDAIEAKVIEIVNDPLKLDTIKITTIGTISMLIWEYVTPDLLIPKWKLGRMEHNDDLTLMNTLDEILAETIDSTNYTAVEFARDEI